MAEPVVHNRLCGLCQLYYEPTAHRVWRREFKRWMEGR